MDINTNLVIGLFFIAILILLLSKITVTVGNSAGNIPQNNNAPAISNKNVVHPPKLRNRESRNITLSQAQGFPEKNDYMSNSLKNQINNLENKFYYNNCRWEPNF